MGTLADVDAHFDSPHEFAGERVGGEFSRATDSGIRIVLGSLFLFDHDLVQAVTVEIAGAGVTRRVSRGVLQGDRNVILRHDVFHSAGRLLLAADNRLDRIVSGTAGGVLVVGRIGDRRRIQLSRASVHVECDIGTRFGPEQPPAQEIAAPGLDGH